MHGFSDVFGQAPSKPRKKSDENQKVRNRRSVGHAEKRYGEASFEQEQAGRIMSFFNARGLRAKGAAPGWALRVFNTDLHKSQVPNCISPGELPQAQRNTNAKDALERDRVHVDGSLKQMAKTHFDRLKNPLDNEQEQRSLSLLFAPMSDFRDIIPQDLIDEALEELENLVEENRKRLEAAAELARSIVTIGGMTLRPNKNQDDDSNHPSATANFTTAQRIDLQGFFQRYTLRVSSNNIDVMYRSSWFRFLGDMKLLSPRHITFSRAKEVFHMFSECQGSAVPILTFASWLNALQFSLKVPNLYPSQHALCEALFTKLLKLCEHRLPESVANRNDSSTRRGSTLDSRGGGTMTLSQMRNLKVDDKSNESWCFNLAEEQICEPEVVLLVEEFRNLFKTIYDQYAVEEPIEDGGPTYPGQDRAMPANPSGFGSTNKLAIVAKRYQDSKRGSKDAIQQASRRSSKESVDLNEPSVDLNEPVSESQTLLLPGVLNLEQDSPKSTESGNMQGCTRQIGRASEASPGGSRPTSPKSPRESRAGSRPTTPKSGVKSGRPSRGGSRRGSRERGAKGGRQSQHAGKEGQVSGSRLTVPDDFNSSLHPGSKYSSRHGSKEVREEELNKRTLSKLCTVDPEHLENVDAIVEAKSEMQGINWQSVKEHLPWQKDRLKERQKLFSNIDVHCNGSLCLAEVDSYLCGVIPYFIQCKQVIERAFNLARNFGHEDPKTPLKYPKTGEAGISDSEWSVEKREFRILLEYLYHCLHLWVIFERMDTRHDGHISFDEFKAALPLLNDWGLDLKEDNLSSITHVVTYLPLSPQKSQQEQAREDNLHSTFDQMDVDHGGHVLFGEFCDWAIKQRINLDPEQDGDPDDDANAAEAQGTFETEVSDGELQEVAELQETLELQLESSRDNVDEDIDLDPEEQAEEIDRHTLFIEQRLKKEDRVMGFWEFLRVLRHFGLYPQMVSLHTARINFADVCSASKQGIGGFPEFVESLCRVCFMYLSVYGNCVQQTTTSKRKFLWIVTWMQSNCRPRGVPTDNARAPLKKSLDKFELHELILGGAMLRPLARGRQCDPNR